MNEFEKNNSVFLSGEVDAELQFSHQVFGEGFYETVLKVSRLSDQYDYVPITISERLVQCVNMDVGSVVSVEGQFRSYNKMVDNRSKLMLTVFVRDIEEGECEGRNPNQIEIVGFVCKDPIYRTTPFKREICDVLLAVNRAYNKSDYIPCIAWGRNARFAGSLSIGSKVSIVGRVQSREYHKVFEDGTGETRVAYEISVNRLSLADEEYEDTRERNG